jgi:ribosomal protein S18 acetylase RimI-like enzyme
MIKSTIPMLFKFNIGEGYDKIFLKYDRALFDLENKIDPTFEHGNFSNSFELKNFNRENIDLYLIMINNKHIGLVVIKNLNDNIWISTFFIDEKYRSLGYGRHIINLIREKYNNRELRLRVLSKNIEGINFYKSCGFKKESTDNKSITMSLKS